MTAAQIESAPLLCRRLPDRRQNPPASAPPVLAGTTSTASSHSCDALAARQRSPPLHSMSPSAPLMPAGIPMRPTPAPGRNAQAGSASPQSIPQQTSRPPAGSGARKAPSAAGSVQFAATGIHSADRGPTLRTVACGLQRKPQSLGSASECRSCESTPPMLGPAALTFGAATLLQGAAGSIPAALAASFVELVRQTGPRSMPADKAPFHRSQLAGVLALQSLAALPSLACRIRLR